MAVTVTTDLTQINPADATGAISVGGVHSQPVADPDSNVQGTACIEARIVNGGGVGYVMCGNTTNYATNDGKHLYIWIRQSMIWETLANNGVNFRIGTTATANYGEWRVVGQDKGIASYLAWVNGCVDPIHPFAVVNGTPPALTSVPFTGLNINWLTGNGKSLAIMDEVKLASKVFVKGGGVSTQGTFAEVSADDESNGRGFVKAIGGVVFVNSGIEWGDTGTATTYFADSLQTVIFEDFSVSGALYLMNFVGNATGTNSCVFGSSTGTGTAKEGSAGVIFRSAGVVPFRVHCMDANVNEAHFFGCSFIGPSALYGCPVRNFKFEDASGPTFTDDTRDANDADASDAPMMPATQALNDATYFGHDAHTYGLNINIGTAKGGTWTLTWEYWNGSTWAALANVTDGTSNFATTGAQTVTWTMPVDWAKTTVDSANRFWVRARISSFTSSGTVPSLTQVNMQMAGDIHAHTSNAEFIGCNFVNMGSIHVKNGAFLKKSVISNSITPAKNGAVDFEDTDPATDTVRDLSIQNCATGILMRGTSTGTTTYNLRNIQFSGNTKDVRVDFPAGATININVLEGSDTPTIDNVNGSTVNVILAPVTFSINVKDPDGNNISGARVLAETAAAGTFPYQASVSITSSAGTATVTHTAHGLKTNDFVVIRGAQPDDYNKQAQITVTGANTYTYSVTSGISSPATGTPVSSFAPVSGTTDASGNISDTRTWLSSQAIKGWVRKSTSAPYYRQFSFTGTVNSASGLSINIQMVSDE